MKKHIPVMIEEFLGAFRNETVRVFFDGTLGAGGHARALLEDHPEIELYIGCDRDERALTLARESIRGFEEKVCLVRANHVDIDRILKEQGISSVDGCLFDLGVSSMQFDEEERGFSFLREGPLDMRMDQSSHLTARDIINGYSEKDLANLFYEFGEERLSRRVAKVVVEARRKKKIETTTELAEVVARAIPRGRNPKIHPATLIFQALRICVNHELETIEETLKKAIRALRTGGIMSVISFHSLEDRIVKNVLKAASKPLRNLLGSGISLAAIESLTKKPLVPKRQEVRDNRRSRSAKMRIARKL